MAEMCFALKMNHKGRLACKATVNDCDGRNGECPFYKTPIQHMASNERAYMRIALLPVYQQQAIADKYYRGEMPWREYAEEYTGTERDETVGAEREGAGMEHHVAIGAYLPPM